MSVRKVPGQGTQRAVYRAYHTAFEAHEDYAELTEQVDAVDEDLAAVEDFLYEDEDEDECDCGCCDDDDLYEVECPKCHDIIYLDEEMLEEEGITCPNCGTDLEFDFDGDCDCGCGCGCDCDKKDADEE